MITNAKKNRLFSTFFLVFFASISLTSCWHKTNTGPQIMAFDIDRDGKQILALFEKEWDWLIPGDRSTYSPEVMLAYRAPHGDPTYAGRMNLSVLREGDQLVGFVAWYLKNSTLAFLNFVLVDPAFRGKRYAEKLVRHAMAAMTQKGVQKVTLVTRPWNKRARAVYDRMGYTQSGLDDDFVYFEYAL